MRRVCGTHQALTGRNSPQLLSAVEIIFWNPPPAPPTTTHLARSLCSLLTLLLSLISPSPPPSPPPRLNHHHHPPFPLCLCHLDRRPGILSGFFFLSLSSRPFFGDSFLLFPRPIIISSLLLVVISYVVVLLFPQFHLIFPSSLRRKQDLIFSLGLLLCRFLFPRKSSPAISYPRARYHFPRTLFAKAFFRFRVLQRAFVLESHKLAVIGNGISTLCFLVLTVFRLALLQSHFSRDLFSKRHSLSFHLILIPLPFRSPQTITNESTGRHNRNGRQRTPSHEHPAPSSSLLGRCAWI